MTKTQFDNSSKYALSLYRNGLHQVTYNILDSRFYVYLEDKCLGSRHVLDIIDIIESNNNLNNPKEGV